MEEVFKLSVLMSVYNGEKSEYLNLSLHSIERQTIKNFEIVLVEDGPLRTELKDTIREWEKKFDRRMRVVRLPEKVGAAKAWNIGLEACRCELVARMDSDDYCEAHRLDTQYTFMTLHPETTVLGSFVSEFDENYTGPFLVKTSASTHEEIVSAMWLRNSINHPSVMYRKSEVLAAGGYDDVYDDDDFLWAKMYVSGAQFHNLMESLVRFRVGGGMYKRRGWRYLGIDLYVRYYLWRNKKIGLSKFAGGCILYTLYRTIPSGLKKAIRETFLKMYAVRELARKRKA